MNRRQSLPRKWLVADTRLGGHLWPAVRALPRGSGIMFLYGDLPRRDRVRLLADLRRVAKRRGLIIMDEWKGEVARVHNSKEIRQARLAGVPLLFVSPMSETRSHPEWKPIPRMRAAALVRLAKAPVIALGGMDARRFRRIQALGFSGWAGIDAWIRT